MAVSRLHGPLSLPVTTAPGARVLLVEAVLTMTDAIARCPHWTERPWSTITDEPAEGRSVRRLSTYRYGSGHWGAIVGEDEGTRACPSLSITVSTSLNHRVWAFQSPCPPLPINLSGPIVVCEGPRRFNPRLKFLRLVRRHAAPDALPYPLGGYRYCPYGP